MTTKHSPMLSIVVPLYNEQASLPSFHESLIDQLVMLKPHDFEIIYCNDGSHDRTLQLLDDLAAADQQIRIVSLTRNFGKEIATTAGLQLAAGQAVMTIDADGQHPVELLPEFIKRWQAGSKVVIGLRSSNDNEGFTKRIGSKLFYSFWRRITGLSLVPGATDYRLIDQTVLADFLRLSEHNRITRGLIDWLGYDREYIDFHAKARLQGTASYSVRKLFKLAIDSMISLSSSPLFATAFIGALVLPVSVFLGLVMVVDKLTGDPLQWHTTGGAYVLVLVLFLIGILLMSQGIIGLYLSHIHSETQNRPLYIIDKEASTRL